MDIKELEKIIQECLSATMRIPEIQFTICKLANLLMANEQKNMLIKNQSAGDEKEESKSSEKEEMSKDIERLEDMIEVKLTQVEKIEKIEKKLSELTSDIKKLNKAIEEQKAFNFAYHEEFIKKFENDKKNLEKFESFDLLNKKLTTIVNKKTKTVTNDKKKSEAEFYKEQKCSNKFKFNGKELTKIFDDNVWHQFIFSNEITYDKEFTFKIKITKSKYQDIMIGIVDYERQKEEQHSSISNNAISYYILNSVKYPGGVKEGNGVVEGETVEVKVNRMNSEISWIVNGIQRASFTHEMLKEKDRKFKPFVEMCNTGDIIEYSELMSV